MNPQFYKYIDFNVKLNLRKKGLTPIHRLSKPINVEIWDYDMLDGHDILGSIKIDVFDSDNYQKFKDFEANELKKINQYKQRIKTDKPLTKDEEYEYDQLLMRKETEYIKKVYTKIDEFKDHTEYKPYK